MAEELYTTLEVAKLTKIPRATLQHWVATRRIATPRLRLRNGKAVRLWTKAQIEQARKLRGTLKPGPQSEK